MCGIAGIFNLNGSRIDKNYLAKMTVAIAHRGPDGDGLYENGFVGLGHRRLAIIDLSPLGKQPMSTQDGRFTITYNGEVYNFREIRDELAKLGHKFRSHTDSEVILYSYVQWQEKCLDRFNGMFAFAIWDNKKRELFLARDRYGIKPLYYTFRGGCFIFGSEQKAILAHPDVQREIDREALLEYFTFQNIFTDRTLLKDIRIFPSGCWAKIAFGDITGRLNLHRYWDFSFREPKHPLSEEEYINKLDYLFQQSVKRQLVSDVELGSYLSGGVDSGSITAIAAKQLPYIKTFTCGFDLSSASGLELGFDERQKAEFMSNLFKTEHYEMVLKAGDMERALADLTFSLEEPRVGQSYPNYYAAKLASRFVKVVLSGAGGDEMFGGYPWRYYRAHAGDNFEEFVDKYYIFWQRLIPNRLIRDVFKPIWQDIKHVWTRDIFRNVFEKHPEKLLRPEDYINSSLYFEAKTFLHGLLAVEDKLSMAHGLETRLPFLDNDLVDFAMEIPVSMKLNNLSATVKIDENEPGRKALRYFEKTNDGKLVFRKVMERYVPKVITESAKQGFSGPDASWFKGESITYVKKIIYNNDSRIYNFFDCKSVQRIVDEHLAGRQNKRLFIWSLLVFEQWCNQFI